jgi:hypothetical protein
VSNNGLRQLEREQKASGELQYLSLVIMIVLFALLSWSIFDEREPQMTNIPTDQNWNFMSELNKEKK